MKNRWLYSTVVLALGVNLFLGAQVYVRSADEAGKNDVYRNLRLFTQVLERVRQDYVDGANLTYQDLVYGALKGMLSTLDPHSEFLDPRKYGDFKDDTEGAYGGVGLQINVVGDFLTVVGVMEDSPSSRVGIRSGQRIVRINDRDAAGMAAADAVVLLRGVPGTEVRMTVERPDDGARQEHTLKREIIKIETVTDLAGGRDFKLGEDRIGYVRLAQFGERTAGELETAIQRLEAQGMVGLVVDLRNNPGGLLDQAAKVCSLFLEPKRLVVTTEGRDPAEHREFRVPTRGSHYEFPLAVLVNEGSASASEIVAGCMQDWERAVVVGERTFGKGSVQSVIEIQDGAALRLTTARYYTPKRRIIHEQGITPDILASLTPEEERALDLQRSPGMLATLSPTEREEVLAVRDEPLERARDLLKGMALFAQRHGKLAKASKVPSLPRN
ncbi:MAG: S41 family peptidase [Verrucomicrobia bacterium]|nr:S41 family peptidase [Verrucomicrobiota bacterium]